MQRSEYNSKFAISQSALKEFRYKSPKRWRQLWIEKQVDLDKNEESFTFGSLVDTILFTPSLIDERFYIADISKIPTGTLEKIIKHVFEHCELAPDLIEVDDDMLPEIETVKVYQLSKYPKQVLEACNINEWNNNWKDDTRINKVIEKGQDYFNLLAQAEGRKVITSEMNLEALNAVKRLQTDKHVKQYFTFEQGYRNVYQLEIFSTYKSNDHYEVPLKCAIDILHIDNENHTLRLCDFKTSHSAHNFVQSIKQFGYCDQLSFYNYMLERALENEVFLEQLGLDRIHEWKILEPINIVIDEVDKVPYVYEYDWRDIHISKEGNSSYLYNLYQTSNHSSRIKKGWMELLEDVCWHIQNDKWEYPVEFYKTGKIKVNLINS